MGASLAARTLQEHPARGLKGKKTAAYIYIPFRTFSLAHSRQAVIHCDINAGE